MRRIAKAACCAALILLAYGCSSAPKKKIVIVEKANQAAEYSKLGDGFFVNGAYDNAIKFYDQALQTNMSIDNLEGIAIAYNSLGRVYLQAKSLEQAEKSFKEALRYAIMSGIPRVRAAALINLGELSYTLKDRDGAESFFKEAEPLAQGAPQVLAVFYHNYGVILRDDGTYPEAETYIKRAAGINNGLKSWTELSSNYFVLASIEARKENWAGAVDYAKKALAADKTAEYSRGIAGDLEAVANYSLKAGSAEDAYGYYLRGFNAWLVVGDVDGVRRCLENLVTLAETLDRKEDYAEYSAKLAKLNASL